MTAREDIYEGMKQWKLEESWYHIWDYPWLSTIEPGTTQSLDFLGGFSFHTQTITNPPNCRRFQHMDWHHHMGFTTKIVWCGCSPNPPIFMAWSMPMFEPLATCRRYCFKSGKSAARIVYLWRTGPSLDFPLLVPKHSNTLQTDRKVRCFKSIVAIVIPKKRF